MGRSKKRKHAQYEEDNTTRGDLGVGATLAHLRDPNPQPEKEAVTEESDSGGEWQVVDNSAKKQKIKNYPGLGYSESHRLQSSIKLGDLQSLVLYCLADGMSPQWVSVRHHGMIKKVVVLLVPGLEKGMFDGSLALDAHEEQTSSGSAHANRTAAPSTEHESSTVDTANHVANNAQSNRFSQNAKSPDDYVPTRLVAEKLPESLKPLADCFEYIWPVRAPGDDKSARLFSPLQGMLQSPITKTQEEKRQDKEIKGPKPVRVGKNWENRRTPATKFVLTREELAENEYILHPAYLTTSEERSHEQQRKVQNDQSAGNGWVDSQIENLKDGIILDKEIEEGSLTAGRKILAIDCEMCTVQGGISALTRISLVSWDGSTFMDELVKPDLPIIDYLTPYSGITPAKLQDVTTSLKDIQTRLLSLLTPSTILIGHSLDSDLAALHLTHPFVIDTSILYPHPRGPPMKSSLKWLAQKYLSREIQKGHGTMGHDSVEDALACLDLVKMKCEKGPQWGTSEATNESIFKRLKRASASSSGDGSNGHAEEGKTGAIIDHGSPERSFGMMASYSIGCKDDAEVVAGVKRAVLGDEDGAYIPGGGVDFTWARLRDLEAARGWWTDRQTPPNPPNTLSNPPSLASTLAQTTAHIRTIHSLLPPCTLFIVYSGTGDPREMARLQEMQRTYKREYNSGVKWDALSVRWTDREEQGLREATRRARGGIGFLGVV